MLRNKFWILLRATGCINLHLISSRAQLQRKHRVKTVLHICFSFLNFYGLKDWARKVAETRNSYSATTVHILPGMNETPQSRRLNAPPFSAARQSGQPPRDKRPARKAACLSRAGPGCAAGARKRDAEERADRTGPPTLP